MDPCEHCEEIMQDYLDRVLDDDERARAEAHLANCSWCAKRYRFETELRQFVRTACEEELSPELKERLAALRTPLV